MAEKVVVAPLPEPEVVQVLAGIVMVSELLTAETNLMLEMVADTVLVAVSTIELDPAVKPVAGTLAVGVVAVAIA